MSMQKGVRIKNHGPICTLCNEAHTSNRDAKIKSKLESLNSALSASS